MTKVKLVVFGVLLSGLMVTGFAQESYLGAKGGVSIPSLVGGGDNEVSRDYRSRVAPNFGGFLEVGVTPRWSLLGELNYAGQGGTREGVQPIAGALPGLPALPAGVYFYGDFKTVAKLNYLEVPVLAKYRWRVNGRTRVFADAGLYYGRLLNAKTFTSGSSTIYAARDKTPLLLPPAYQPLPAVSFNAETDIKNDVYNNNYGFTGGGGIEIPRGRNYFLVDVRVSYGFRSVQMDTVRNGNSHTGNLVVSLGYAFGLKR